ncbi:MAG: cytochrome b/b6 domain-containing protein [Paracoccaceae bacterium]|nr:cytochrome b/b6 domain-containing protein [Paracoccaceae bacterium]
MHSSQEKNYHFGQIILHWLIAVLVFYQYVSSNGFSDDKLNKCKNSELASVECDFFASHYQVGLFIFGLMILRVGMRLYFGAPMLSNKVPSIIKVLGKISHLALYLLVIAMPITGLLGWYVDSGTVLPIHKGLSNVLLSLILIHICAVGFHEGVLGSSLIQRMVAFNTKLKK